MDKAVYDHSWISSFVAMCFHFFLGKSLEMELLGYVVSVCLKTVFPRPELRAVEVRDTFKGYTMNDLRGHVKEHLSQVQYKAMEGFKRPLLKSGLKVRLKMEDPVKRTLSLQMT